ncbi:MAG TPA: hypothetical protein PKE64_10570 [Anaerolineae bacterium]|nr:hypothetical protein [Anaerolineae bacterium]HMR64442.1 hypothetical protein [Anaerolineae bacterium]
MVINVEWQERGPVEDNGQQLIHKGRQICTPDNYPKRLPCHNPKCQFGGFEIGDRIADLLASRKFSEENSLICINAINEDRDRRCLHTIIYTITSVSPYRRASDR